MKSLNCIRAIILQQIKLSKILTTWVRSAQKRRKLLMRSESASIKLSAGMQAKWLCAKRHDHKLKLKKCSKRSRKSIATINKTWLSRAINAITGQNLLEGSHQHHPHESQLLKATRKIKIENNDCYRSKRILYETFQTRETCMQRSTLMATMMIKGARSTRPLTLWTIPLKHLQPFKRVSLWIWVGNSCRLTTRHRSSLKIWARIKVYHLKKWN